MRTTSHQALADRIRLDVVAAQRLYLEDPSVSVQITESALRTAWSALEERIVALKDHGIAERVAFIAQSRARYPRRQRRWSLARLLGLV
jgi:hypothetical protein